MKKSAGLVLAFVMVMGSTVWAERGQVETSISGKKVSIEYGRPALQGRDMLSRLPVGNSWRMGKDTATTLKSDAGLKFGDTVVPAGSYRLTAKRVAEDAWHLVFTPEGGSAVEVPLKNHSASESVELFTIKVEDAGNGKGKFSMAWGTWALGTEFSVQ